MLIARARHENADGVNATMKQDPKDLIVMLLQTVPKVTARELAKECRDRGMTTRPYVAIPENSRLPPFEVGYHFRFETDNALVGEFEVLEKDEVVLQAGFQMYFRKSLFRSKARNAYPPIVEHLEEHYGAGVPMNVQGTRTLNYGDALTVCYVAWATTPGMDVITVRIGNRAFWQ